MGKLKDYADIQISFEAQTVSRAGFGTLMFLTEDSTKSAGTVSPVFSSLEELVDDGYATSSEPYKFAQAAFSQGEGFSRLKISHKDSNDSWVDALSDTVSTDSDFYALGIESRDVSDIESISTAIQAQKRLFIGVSEQSEILDGQDSTDVASILLGLNNSRTGLFYLSTASSAYPEAAWFAKMLPQDPGTVNWAWKTLSGITPDDFTSGQRAALRAKRCNYYETVAGNSITYEGVTSQPGFYLDIIRGIDWLEQRMQEDFVALQGSQQRIPYVGGGEIIESEVVRRRLNIAVDRGVLNEDYEVFVPSWRDQDPTDRANRFFAGITFTATYVGAVNSIEVRGVVQP